MTFNTDDKCGGVIEFFEQDMVAVYKEIYDREKPKHNYILVNYIGIDQSNPDFNVFVEETYFGRYKKLKQFCIDRNIVKAETKDSLSRTKICSCVSVAIAQKPPFFHKKSGEKNEEADRKRHTLDLNMEAAVHTALRILFKFWTLDYRIKLNVALKKNASEPSDALIAQIQRYKRYIIVLENCKYWFDYVALEGHTDFITSLKGAFAAIAHDKKPYSESVLRLLFLLFFQLEKHYDAMLRNYVMLFAEPTNNERLLLDQYDWSKYANIGNEGIITIEILDKTTHEKAYIDDPMTYAKKVLERCYFRSGSTSPENK
ncbi:MAG: hypothetical protein FWD49_02710 [Firmicutes bacterium]|nr:hypothetical protein [Bacillota bacterium]